jgi:hypothetical protein
MKGEDGKRRVSKKKRRQKMDERPTLHLPDFEGSHLIGALHQVFPQLLQLLLEGPALLLALLLVALGTRRHHIMKHLFVSSDLEHNTVLKPPTVSLHLEHIPLEPPTDFSDHEDHTM